MSHKATHWAIQQRGLKPATKLVLWYLCDRHTTDYGCFPSQLQLAEDAELSSSALNEHLLRLEAAGLIRRIRRLDPRTRRQQSTRYLLAFEPEFHEEPTPESGHGPDEADAERMGKPTPDSGHGPTPESETGPTPDLGPSRLRIPETNSVREQEEEEEEEEEERAGAGARFERFFDELLRTVGHNPDVWIPGWWKGDNARDHVRGWIDGLGLSEDRIIEIAEAWRRDIPDAPDGPKALDRAMAREAEAASRRKADALRPRQPGKGGKAAKASEPEKPKPSYADVAAFHAEWVNSDRFLPSNAISTSLVRTLLERGLVTEARLRERGL
jgi:DNA-binding MarR family transcriptional regulator